MLYNLVYALVLLTRRFYFRHFAIDKKRSDWSAAPKARLFAVNHHNSFLDPILLATQLPFPTHFLARGDALQGKIGAFLMKHFYILPVWREREGRDNLKANYSTFDRCQQIWQDQGSVMIFSEGLCENDWHLKPLPKGTARLVWQAHEQKQVLEIIPTGINYEHFRGPGKQCEIRVGAPMPYADLLENTTEARFYREFNARLFSHLQPLVIEADSPANALTQFAQTTTSNSLFRGLAKLLHWPYYPYLKNVAARSTANTVHYDAVLFGMLMLSYPVFLLVIASVLAIIGLPYLWFGALLWPLVAYLGR